MLDAQRLGYLFCLKHLTGRIAAHDHVDERDRRQLLHVKLEDLLHEAFKHLTLDRFKARQLFVDVD